jgi:hypothetical protein
MDGRALKHLTAGAKDFLNRFPAAERIGFA